MSCCGKKRAEWLRGTAVATASASGRSERDAPNENAGLFRYIGSGQLMVTGAHTGNFYHFTFPGETLEVAYEDAFALRAERDLQLVRNRQQS